MAGKKKLRNKALGEYVYNTEAVDALAASAVRLAGDQTVGGEKTFAVPPRLASANRMAAEYSELASKYYVDNVAANGVPPPLDGSQWEAVPVARNGNSSGGSLSVWLNRFIGIYMLNAVSVNVAAGVADDTVIASIPSNYPVLTNQAYLHFSGSHTDTTRGNLIVRGRDILFDRPGTGARILYASALFPAGL